MSKYFYTIGLILSFCLAGCHSHRQQSLPATAPAINLTDGDTIYSTKEHYILDIDVNGPSLLLKFRNEQTVFAVIDANSGNASMTITTGDGPDDVVDGKIMKTMARADNNAFVLYDNNVGRIFYIDAQQPGNTLLNHTDRNIIECSALCINDSITIGHQSGSDEQFYIWNKRQNKIIYVEHCISASQKLAQKLGAKYEYVRSTCLAANPARDRILSFSYFFDNIATYTLGGAQLKPDTMPEKADKEISDIIERGNYWSYCLPYATANACYVKSIRYENDEPVSLRMLKLNWDGELLQAYQLPQNMVGGYAIEHDTTLYCIIADLQQEDETYHVIKYPLPH